MALTSQAADSHAQPEALKALLASIIRGDKKVEMTEASVDCETLLNTIKYEGVASLLIHSQRNGTFTFSQKITRELHNIARNQVVLNMIRHRENLQVFEALLNKQIDFIVLKGEALAYSVYSTPHSRDRADTDILFANKIDAENGWEILKKLGYERGNILEGKFVGFQFPCSKSITPNLKITLDIHNELSDYLWFAKRFNFTDLLNEAQIVDYGHLKISVMSNIHGLFHACIHRVANKPLRIENRLIWLYDIHLLAKRLSQSEWQIFIEIAQKISLATIALEGLSTTEKFFPGTLPSNISTALNKIAATEKNFFNGHQRWKFYLEDFWLNKGLGNKLTQVKEHLVPSRGYMERKYRKLAFWELPFFYVKRLFEGIGRYR